MQYLYWLKALTLLIESDNLNVFLAILGQLCWANLSGQTGRRREGEKRNHITEGVGKGRVREGSGSGSGSGSRVKGQDQGSGSGIRDQEQGGEGELTPMLLSSLRHS